MRNLKILGVMLIALTALISCGPDPTQAIEDAKTALERALTVEADVYAEADYLSAEEAYTTATNLVEEKDKSGALDMATTAKTLADQAHDIAAEKRAEDIYEKCSFLMESAELYYADTILADDYTEAEAMFEGLTSAYESGEYVATYDKGLLLYDFLTEMVETCKTKIETTSNAIQDAQDQYDKAENNDIVVEYALEDLELAEPLLEEARQAYNDGDFDTALEKANAALDSIEAAIAKAEEAYAAYQADLSEQQSILEMQRQEQVQKEKEEAERLMEEVQQLLEELEGQLNGYLGPIFNEYAFEYVEVMPLIGANVINESTPEEAEIIETEPVALEEAVETEVTTVEEIDVDIDIDESEVTEELVQYYFELALEAYDNGEYLDSADYSREALRLGEILVASKTETTYTVILNVDDRDCLWKIAGRFYDNKTWLWPLIWRANKYDIEDPDLIYPGQVFVIPPSIGE